MADVLNNILNDNVVCTLAKDLYPIKDVYNYFWTTPRIALAWMLTTVSSEERMDS